MSKNFHKELLIIDIKNQCIPNTDNLDIYLINIFCLITFTTKFIVVNAHARTFVKSNSNQNLIFMF
ncbi:hypothetical protein AMR41_05225 [Hapalosiphon sp. MRB220]|nr:hypothetical protein AMR41_05225 [Hapalosiphon sp. MRB220]